jgi:hypothetical protein
MTASEPTVVTFLSKEEMASTLLDLEIARWIPRLNADPELCLRYPYRKQGYIEDLTVTLYELSPEQQSVLESFISTGGK